jgi:hypothetical protein
MIWRRAYEKSMFSMKTLTQVFGATLPFFGAIFQLRANAIFRRINEVKTIYFFTNSLYMGRTGSQFLHHGICHAFASFRD